MHKIRQTLPQAGSASSHTVQAGESLNIIPSRYGVSVDQLMAANNLHWLFNYA